MIRPSSPSARWSKRARKPRPPVPPAGAPSRRLARNGITVSATNSEAVIVNRTAAGSERMNSPAPSGRNNSGRKPSTSVAVQPITASAIWSVARIAASTGGRPLRTWRAMFSTTTIESSTSSPSATTKPTIDSWFRLKPAKYSSDRPIASDSGMEIITTPAERRPSGSSVSSTSAIARAKSPPSLPSRWATLRDWSKPRSRRIPGGSAFSNAGSFA